ncbi:unnamed protein product [Heligmosomoides polygyrus]|uniref:Reverse transcriptase domain-containing protein n=1 Tax=Heligmosomoides polygyrus TaxID=6339 RepID=A0A183G9A9_HELPZ|nr:unnamed protein product [Heligmosomoides polygyrus]
MDAIIRDFQKPVPWTLLYADDVMLACEDKDELEREVQAWCDRLERFGLRLNVKKTEYLTTDVTESSSIKVNGIELPRTSVFKYLGSAVASDGNLMTEVNSRVSAAWSNTLRMDMKVTGVHPDQAQDLERWRHDTRKEDLATMRNKR